MQWARSIRLDDKDDWEDYAGRIESAVAALELEEFLRAPVRVGDGVKSRTVLDASDPDSAQPQEVLDITDEQWEELHDSEDQKAAK